MSVQISQLTQEFLIEANENIAAIVEALPKLERSPTDKELFNSIYRGVHTIKGGARFVKMSSLDAFAHVFENFLDELRENQSSIDARVIDALLAGSDHLGQYIRQIQDTGSDAGLDSTQVLEKIQNLKAGSTPPPAQSAAPPESALATSEARTEPKGEPRSEDRNLADSVVRVNVNLLDKIMNVVGELVLTRNQILQYANKMDSSEFHKLSMHLNVITTEIQGDIMRTRMQPIGSVLGRFERIVRDMARELGKKISLRIEGKETELDKTLLEAIKDPLTHMVRNAVDHALENPADRRAAGKSEEGVVLVKAYHEGGQVTIEIKDDGRGISRQKVLQKAIEKGIVTSDRAAQLSDKEILNLIFLPGFSTASQVTSISGRGVGMDVVRTNIERIGGQIDLTSEERIGTTFKLRIPLTLAIIPALIVKDAGESFALPQINLVELVRLEGEKLDQVEHINGAEFFRLRGDLIPLLRLKKILKLEPESQTEHEDANIVVLNAEGRLYGLIVDSILDTQEIVVKPLSKQLKGLNFYGGATIMGDGHVALILDALGIAKSSALDSVASSTATEIKAQMGTSRADSQEILLFRLNDSGVFAVPLITVNRLEEFSADRVELIGENRIIRYREQPMPLIDLASVLGHSRSGGAAKSGIIPVFVVVFGGQYVGFEVNEIIDIAMTDFDLKTTSLIPEGLMGTLFVQNKTVSLVDLYWIAQRLGLRGQVGLMHENSKSERTALVVDDMALFRKIATLTLGELGYSVLSANDGAQALEVLHKHAGEISLVVSDIEMPNMNGFELARQVRGSSDLKHIPMIAISSKYSSKDVEIGRSAGFNCYLEKFKKSEVIASIRNLMDTKEAA